MDQGSQKGMKKLLIEDSDVFAWSEADMLSISPMVITHTLNVNPEARPIKQKKRKSVSNRIQAAKEEAEKLLKVGFIKEIQYPNWLSNVVMMKKASSK